MKKVTAMLLLLALFMSLALPASANAVEPCYVCTHNYNLVNTTQVGVYFNPDGHKIKTVKTYVCMCRLLSGFQHKHQAVSTLSYGCYINLQWHNADNYLLLL